MTLVKGTIGLEIHERLPLTDRSEYSHRANQKWFDNLPRANLGETSREVYHRIVDSNKLLLKVADRAKFLELIEPTVTSICTSLKKHYTGRTVSLSGKQKKIANLCQALQLELIIGYKTIIEDLIADEKYDNSLLPLAVNQIFILDHEVQTRTYQLYRELSKGFWQELHLLFQLAEQNQFHESSTAVRNKSDSILTNYKKILLLSTTNPNQLRQKEIDKIAIVLGKLAKLSDLSSAPDGDFDFVINLHSDSSPFHSSLMKENMKGNHRGLNVHQAVIQLQETLKSNDTNKSTFNLDESMIRHLLSAWGTLATRIFSRSSGTGSIQVSIGLAGCHYLINRELYGAEEIAPQGEFLLDSLEGSLKDAIVVELDDNPNYSSPKKRHPDWNKSISGPMVKKDLLWDSIYVSKSAGRSDEEQAPYDFMSRNKEAKSQEIQYDYNEATIINVSPGGYSLKLDGDLPKQTQTGEIIGLLELKIDGSYIWNIGNIRWMLRHETGELQLGIQLIAPDAVPVFAQVRTDIMDDNSFQRCLLLPSISGIGQPPTILTSPMPFTSNQKLSLKNSDDTYDIYLTKLLSSGHNFKQFEYNELDIQHQEEEKEEETNIGHTDFDSVWDLI